MTKENTSAPAAENKMGTMPIGKLLFNMSLPMMISMLVQALYNIVDSIFVAKLSENALTAVSLAFPLQTLLIAVATGTGVGMNALLSRSLGEHKFKEANKIGVNAAFLYFLSYLVFLILGFTVVKPFYASQIKGADAEIMEMGIEYLRTVMIFSFGLLAQIYFERLLTSTGKTLFSMTSQLCGALTNIILDPIMIFGLLGCPAMGVTGAAVATVIGQFVGCLAGMMINKKWNPEIPFAFTLKPDWVSVREIIKVGFPSTLVQILTSVVNMAMNAIIITFSSTAVAAFGVCTKIQNITTVGVHGITNGLIPIVAYNYGAKQKERIRQSIRYGILYGGGLFLIFFAVLEFCPGVVLKLFDASDNLMRIGVPALRILAVAYLLSIPGLIYQAALQGLSLGKESMYISMTRQAILPLVFAFLLKGFGNLNLIWGAFVLAELCGIPLAAALWKRKGEKQIQF